MAGTTRFGSSRCFAPVVSLALAVVLTVIATPGTGESIGPGARGYHSMVYDAQSNRIVMFGGIIADTTIAEGYRPVADTWALDVSSMGWERLAPSSQPWLSSTDTGQDDDLVGFGPLAYDVESDAIVYFRSIVDNYSNPTPGFEASPANETWALQGAKVQWVRMGTGNREAPSAGRFGPRMAYDAQSDRIILFGGWNLTDQTFPRDTWAYDYNTNTWRKMSPAVSPPGRNYHRMIYDPGTDRVILFGGFAGTSLGDMWAYDYDMDAWTPLNPAVAPSSREYHAMAYDARSRVIVLFGGVGGPSETPNADTWVYDPATNVWTQRSPSTAPSARGWHDMAYDSSIGRIVLFGGGPTRFSPTNETWLYDTANNTWALAVAPSPLATGFTFAPASPQAGQTITFTANPSGGAGPYTYSWDWGDGTPSGSGLNPSHVYANAGTFTVTLTTSDSMAHTATTSKPVLVTAAPGSSAALVLGLSGAAIVGAAAVAFLILRRRKKPG